MTIRNVKNKDNDKKITYWAFGSANYQRAKSRALELDGEVIEIEDTENGARGYGVVAQQRSKTVEKLFEKGKLYTKAADALDLEVIRVLQPIFKKWAAKGYSPREIEYIMTRACVDLANTEMLGWS